MYNKYTGPGRLAKTEFMPELPEAVVNFCIQKRALPTGNMRPKCLPERLNVIYSDG